MRLLMLAVLAALSLVACNTKFVGESCSNSNDVCDSVLFCREDFPGGFCTEPCSPRGDSAGCPLDSLCINEGGRLMCSPVCTHDTDCRSQEGYECRGESGSSVRACRIKPQTDGGVP